MTPIRTSPVTGAMAWRGTDFRSKDDIAFDLTRRHVDALRELLLQAEKTARDDLAFEQCRHQDLGRDLRGVLEEIQLGRGIVILRGLPVGEHSEAEVERMFWIVGQHIGAPLSQNSLGERMVPVREERMDGAQSVRANKSNQELALHSDETEVFSLLCVRQSGQGGESQFVSSMSLYNEVLARRPDLLPTLYRGFPYHRRGEHAEGVPPVSDYDVPVYSNLDGNVSCHFIRHVALAGMHALGREPTPQELDAMNTMRDIAGELKFECKLAPGEAVIANNFIVLHSRSGFEAASDPARGRLLLRLWLEPREWRRPVVPEIRTHRNRHGRSGVDPVPGRTIKPNEYAALSEAELRLLKASTTDAA